MAGNYHKTKEVPVSLTPTQIKMLAAAATYRLKLHPSTGGVPNGPERRSLEAGKTKLLEAYFGKRGGE